MKAIGCFSVFLFSIVVYGQHSVSGIVINEQNQPLMGANVYLEGTYDGASTNEEGSFIFTSLKSGIQTLVVSMLGFETCQKTADISSFTSIKVKLKENVNVLDAVVLTAGTFEAGDKSRVSVLKPLDIVTTAGAAGDIIGALTTLPGTQTVGEDGRLFVRGGEAYETQTFVDGLRVAQPFGPTANNLPTRSRFSPFLFDGISFSTGGYSAEFGEALSSILSLNTIDIPVQNQTDISLMTVGIGVGNTQKRERKSLTFNLNYINLLPYQRLVPQAVDWNTPVQSMGGEMVYRYQLKNGLLKVYGAFDVTLLDINLEDINRPEKIRFDLKNQNFYGNMSYKGSFSEDWFLHTGISYGTGTNRIGIDLDQVQNQENALHLKWKITKRLTKRFKLSTGIDYFYTDFQETLTTISQQTFPLAYDNHLGAAYMEADWFLNKKYAVKVGARGSRSDLLQEYKFSPRISMAYKVSKTSQFSIAFGDFTQAPNGDILKFNPNLRSEQALHYILNYQYQNEGRLLRAEAYFKDYQHLVTFDSERPHFNSVFTNNGFGYAKGLDIFWRDNKTFKGTDYWVSYSFIDSEREYLNFPSQATPTFIANHTLSLVTKHWIQKLTSQIGFSYTINSGRPYNNPNESEFMKGRTKAFQNLSFNWAYLITQQKIVYFSVSNILGTDNVFGYQYANSPNMNGQFPRRAIGQPADRFFFVGFFWTISDNKKTNQLNNL
jgi:hypothetical protein